MSSPVSTRTDAAVTISISRDPALVRTVRLVAAAVARRVDADEALIEEIRFSVGEACAVMIGTGENDSASDGHVDVRITTDDHLTVTVSGRADGTDANMGEMGLDPWALLRGLSDNVTVEDADGRTTLRMSWPV
ncbi:ATP-binding protein [Nocardioides caldifontis]|uniref:ATP-binding protein n=1 Tax=Nocardioides caldifontis TaxID=2588938 RepID=UPI0011DFADF1|nr:ATP-binding protein [Nocardioides caldifontis]